MSDGRQLHRAVGSWDRAVGSWAEEHRWILLAVVVVGANTLWWGQSSWFSVDAWDWIAARRFGDPADWLRPHGSHWTLPQFVLLRGSYLLGGLDWWPWFPLITALVDVIALVTINWVLRARGVDATVAAAVAGGIAMMWTLDQPAHLGRPLGVAVASLLAVLVGSSLPWARTVVVLAGLLAVMSGPSTVFIAASAVVAALVMTDWRRTGWWWPPLVPVVAYVLWRLVWLPSAAGPAGLLTRLELRRVPEYVYETTAGVLRFSGPLVVVVAVGLAALVLWPIVTRRVDTAGWVLLAGTAGLALVTIAIRSTHDFGRFGTQFVSLVVIAVLPALSTPSRQVVAAGLLGLGLLRLAGPDDHLTAVRELRREQFPAVATLEGADEPIHGGPPVVDLSLYGHLTSDMVQRLLTEGYSPPPVTEQELIAARGARRVLGWPAGQPSGFPLEGLDGCAPLADTSSWRVAAPGTIVIRGVGGVRWRWEDEWGTGVGDYRSPSSGDRFVLHLADGAATLRLRVDGPGEVCQWRSM